jgi:hypothetical protein
MSKFEVYTEESEAAFAMEALTEIPGQYRDIQKLGLLSLK